MAWQRLRLLILIGALTITWMMARPTPSLACSCVSGPLEADVVFLGRVILVVEGAWVEERLHAWNLNVGSTVAFLKVEEMRQGPPRPFYTVIGGTGAGDCSVRFELDASYLIHGLHRRFGPLETNTCLGSHSLDDVPVEIAI